MFFLEHINCIKFILNYQSDLKYWLGVSSTTENSQHRENQQSRIASEF